MRKIYGVALVLFCCYSAANADSLHDVATEFFMQCMKQKGDHEWNKNACINSTLKWMLNSKFPEPEKQREEVIFNASREHHSCFITKDCDEKLKLH